MVAAGRHGRAASLTSCEAPSYRVDCTRDGRRGNPLQESRAAERPARDGRAGAAPIARPANVLLVRARVWLLLSPPAPVALSDNEWCDLIDVMEVDPARQPETLEFNLANSDGFADQAGFRATSVLRGIDGNADRRPFPVGAGRGLDRRGQDPRRREPPTLNDAETVDDVNAALAEPGRQIGAVPEYRRLPGYRRDRPVGTPAADRDGAPRAC
jgi:hypothetical protein